MKRHNDPPCWREAKAWAEEQEDGDAVAAWLIALLVGIASLAWLLLC